MFLSNYHKPFINPFINHLFFCWTETEAQWFVISKCWTEGRKLGWTSIEIFKGQDGQVHSISFHFIPTYALQCTAIVHAETSFSHSRPPERPVEPQAVSEADNLFLVYNVYIIMCNVCIYSDCKYIIHVWKKKEDNCLLPYVTHTYLILVVTSLFKLSAQSQDEHNFAGVLKKGVFVHVIFF